MPPNGMFITWEQIATAVGAIGAFIMAAALIVCRHTASFLEKRVIGKPMKDPDDAEPTLSKMDAQLEKVHTRISAKFGELEPRVRKNEEVLAVHDQRLKAGGL